jgi:hypothetical protein
MLFPTEIPEAAWLSPTTGESTRPRSSADAGFVADDTVTIFPGQYERCRIQVSGLPAQQYAIKFNEQFYSLLCSGISKEDALETVKQLEEQEERTAILTHMNQGYAVWVAEPTADLVEVA